MIVCEALEVFPQRSVKVHVLVIISGQVPPLETSVPVTDPAGSQLSVYPRFVIAGTSAKQETVTAVGAAANIGAVTSSTVIV